MKKKEMKKVLPAIVAVVLVLGAGLALANNDNRQGVPSAKCAASVQGINYDPAPGDWVEVPEFYTIIKTSNKADLIISVTAECALATNVTIKGSGKDETSTSEAQLEIRVLVDNDEANPATPGNVTFARRLMVLKGLLYSGAQVDEMADLPEQYISIYEETKTANGFNFVMKNVSSGVHIVTVEARAKQVEDNPKNPVGFTPVIGKRTLVVEAVRMVND